ncbi:MAG: MFS transporter [Marinomonas sp.]|uniref:MFS transporter n=1 Tax=Alphaproteobacteria TaxID=28211 RepID=UPI003267B1E4
MTDTALRNDEGIGGALGKTGFAWAIFEWARNPYYILIVIFVFAPYFARDIIGADLLASGKLDNLSPEAAKQAANAQGQAAIASVTKWAGFAAALSAPILGAALDRGGRRKPILALMLGTIAVLSWLLWYAVPGEEGLPTRVIMLILVVAYVSFTFSEVTHNSMLTAAGRADRLSMISGLALGLGNLAAVLIFAALVCLFVLPAMIQWPFQEPQFGIDLDRFEHMRIVGPICAVWLAVFSVPFFLYGKDPGTRGASWITAIKSSMPTVLATLRKASDHKELMKFLLARMFYADGVAALLALGAVYVSLFLEWGFLEITCYAIVGSVFAFAGGIFGGWLDTQIGVKRALMIEIFVMATAFALQLSLTTQTMLFGLYDNFTVWDGLIFQTASDIAYLALIALIAIAATASISSSRAMLVTLAPKGRSGEFFGLFAIAGTITVWMGPLLVELGTNATGNQRVGMASIGMLFLIGFAGLIFVNEERYE